MTDKTKPTKAAVMTSVAELSKKITFAIAKDSGPKSTSEKAYEENLPENVSAEQVLAIQNYNANFTVAHELASVKHSLDHWAADPKHREQTKLEFSTPGIGSDEFNTVVEASRTYSRKDKESGETINTVKHGVTTSSHDTFGHPKSIFTNSLAETREAIEKLFAK